MIKENSSLTSIKNLTMIFVFISMLLTGSGVIVRYSTMDLKTKVENLNTQIEKNEKQLDKKADKAIVDQSLQRIEEKIQDLKEDQKEQGLDIKEILKRLSK